MSIKIIRELYSDGCQRLMRELEQGSPEVVKTKGKVEYIASELKAKNPDFYEMLDKYEEAQIQLKVEEAFDIFQKGFKLGFYCRNNLE